MARSIKVDSTISCDVLIIGAGGAALRCGAEILERLPGADVIALTKDEKLVMVEQYRHGTDAVSLAVANVLEITERNRRSAEVSSTGAKQLAGQTTRLHDMLARFTLSTAEPPS